MKQQQPTDHQAHNPTHLAATTRANSVKTCCSALVVAGAMTIAGALGASEAATAATSPLGLNAHSNTVRPAAQHIFENHNHLHQNNNSGGHSNSDSDNTAFGHPHPLAAKPATGFVL